MSHLVRNSADRFSHDMAHIMIFFQVDTHAGTKGERTKYFDDDDKFDLKTMVSEFQ